jgi:hypothetical protein
VYYGCNGEIVNSEDSFICHLYINNNRPIVESWNYPI